MTICYFGAYNINNSRNKVLIKGLRKNGVKVIECHSDKSGLIDRYKELIKKHKRIRDNYDVMIVGAMDYRSLPLAWILTSKKIIYDAYISQYDTKIFDRERYKPKSLMAMVYYCIDWISCRLASKVILDTEAHVQYFYKTFSVPKSKLNRVFIGADPDMFYPREREEDASNKFIVHFHGTYIPLQGIEYIVRAAKILEKDKSIVFNLIGSGQTYDQVRKISDKLDSQNINFVQRVEKKKLADLVSESDVCLGIFGDTDKAERVIPNKVYEAIAMKKPVITSRTRAIDELLENNKHYIGCNSADPGDLAEKILILRRDPDLRTKIALNGHSVFRSQLNAGTIGAMMKSICSQLLEENE